jgi:hypothetical protein
MIKTIIAGVLLLPALLQAAEPVPVEKKVVCIEAKEAIQILVEKYKEKIIWISGQSDKNTQIAVFVNPSTGTWSVVEQVGPNICVLGDGTGFSYRLPPNAEKNSI